VRLQLYILRICAWAGAWGGGCGSKWVPRVLGSSLGGATCAIQNVHFRTERHKSSVVYSTGGSAYKHNRLPAINVSRDSGVLNVQLSLTLFFLPATTAASGLRGSGFSARQRSQAKRSSTLDAIMLYPVPPQTSPSQCTSLALPSVCALLSSLRYVFSRTLDPGSEDCPSHFPTGLVAL
jgi:hypothetical protein